MDLREIQKQCVEDSLEWFPKTTGDLGFLTIAMVGEVGEFANELKKGLRGSPHSVARMREELTDVFIYLCNIAEELGMDLEEAYVGKRERNAQRFGRVQS